MGLLPPPKRRLWLQRALAAWSPVLLTACAAPWPEMPADAGSSSARDRLQQSALAHGLLAWRGLRDINLGCSAPWPSMLARLGPMQRGEGPGVQLRLLPARGLLALAHQGAAGPLQVLRSATDGGSGELRLWLDNRPVTDPGQREVAALLADGCSMFLFGPMLLADFAGAVQWGPPETLDGRRCDQLQLLRTPGLGLAPSSRLSLFVDREQGLMRRLRLSLDGVAATAGRVAEVDCGDHRLLHGVWWPRRFSERQALALTGAATQDWRLTGLDVNRGYGAEAISGPVFSGVAAAPARALPSGI